MAASLAMIARLFWQTFIWLACVGVLLFGAAGTLRWPAGWIYLAEMGALGLAGGFWLARHDPDLLRERLSPLIQPTQVASDRLLVAALILSYGAWHVLMGLDAKRFGLWHFPLWLRILGALLIALSMYIGLLTFRENSFAAPVVKVQRERGHRVITTGPYRIVRHPMYAGALLMFVGAPLLLCSLWGLIAVPVMIVVLGTRIGIEERTLRTNLEGYTEYMQRVPYRLIPFVW
jgi:protein-S-isoprenylcysteine O-methyltransferase Ste14